MLGTTFLTALCRGHSPSSEKTISINTAGNFTMRNFIAIYLRKSMTSGHGGDWTVLLITKVSCDEATVLIT